MKCVTEWIGRCIHWQFSGIITADTVIEVISGLYGHERFDDTRAQIRDFRDITLADPSIERVQTIAAFDRAAALSNPNMRVAVVTTEHLDHQMLTSLYCAELDGTSWEVKMFHCLEAAKGWATEVAR